MNILSMFQNNPITSTSSNRGSLDVYEAPILLGGGVSLLPVVAIPRSIVDKFDYKKIDYRKAIASTVITTMNVLGYEDSEIKHSKEVIDAVGLEDAVSIYALTKKILSGDNHSNSSIYEIINFTLSENDYNKEIINLSHSLSSGCLDNVNKKCFDIESDANGFYIIMNDNSFIDFSSVYKDLSREMCVRMLQYIDESFVYRSVFFRAL